MIEGPIGDATLAEAVEPATDLVLRIPEIAVIGDPSRRPVEVQALCQAGSRAD